MDKLNINQWAEEDRPREKLMRLGADALSNAELMAILIGSGNTKENAVDLMKKVLNDCNNNLNTLGKMSIQDLCRYNGIGEAKAITILAACEFGKRRQMETPEERPDLGTATRIYNHMHPVLQDKDVESVDIRIIMREAVLANATILAVCHNHPSGNLLPSSMDNDLTDSIKRACNLMRIRFLDHVIITDGAYFSYHESGRL